MPHPKVQDSPYKFAEQVGRRIFSEWCMAEGKDCPTKHSEYEGQAFTCFINNEIHYLLNLRSAGTRKTQPETDVNNHEEYAKARHDVLKGLVNCAIHYMNKNQTLSQIEGNLRCDLQAWISE